MALSGRSLDDQPLAAYARRGSDEAGRRPSCRGRDPVRRVRGAGCPEAAAAPAGAGRPADPDGAGRRHASTSMGPPFRRSSAGPAPSPRQNPRLVAGGRLRRDDRRRPAAPRRRDAAPRRGERDGKPERAGRSCRSPPTRDRQRSSSPARSTGRTRSPAPRASRVAGTAVAATWADTLQNVLSLDGPVDRGHAHDRRPPRPEPGRDGRRQAR